MWRRTFPFLVLALIAAGPASAGSIGVVLGLAGGELSVAAPHAAVSASASVRVPVTLVDATGSGRGWTLHLVSARPVVVESMTARCAPHTTCTLPRRVADAESGVLLRAAPATGMGAITLVITFAPLPSGAPHVPVSFRVS